MKKDYTKVPIGDGIRHTVILRDEPSDGSQIHARQMQFLQDFANNGPFTGLFACGPVPFTVMTMRHDGTSWVIRMEAVENQGMYR
jgi:hypothetical protein